LPRKHTAERTNTHTDSMNATRTVTRPAAPVWTLARFGLRLFHNLFVVGEFDEAVGLLASDPDVFTCLSF